MTIVHATAVAFDNFAVLIRGPSGSGKSDLALRLIDQSGFGLGTTLLRASLIADDQVVIRVHEGRLYATPPLNLAGKLEIRGFGIVEVPWVENLAVALIVDLLPIKSIERMPDEVDLKAEILGITLPRLMIEPFTYSACARIRSFPFHLK